MTIDGLFDDSDVEEAALRVMGQAEKQFRAKVSEARLRWMNK